MAGRTFKEACCVCEKCQGAVDEKGSEVDGKLWCSKCAAKARRASSVARTPACAACDAPIWGTPVELDGKPYRRPSGRLCSLDSP